MVVEFAERLGHVDREDVPAALALVGVEVVLGVLAGTAPVFDHVLVVVADDHVEIAVALHPPLGDGLDGRDAPVAVGVDDGLHDVRREPPGRFEGRSPVVGRVHAGDFVGGGENAFDAAGWTDRRSRVAHSHRNRFPPARATAGMHVSEGGVEIEVPDARDGASAGTGDDVFYNPTQELNRDITAAVLRAFREREPRAESYLDAMAASGIRGVRAAAEGYDVTCADLDTDAVELAQSNLDRAGNGGEAVHRNANALMYDSVFDVVDLDPFGTPMPFADPAFANTRDLVCVTATDTAPLCGAHQKSGIRKYGCLPQNTDYHPEMGLRTLLGAMVRTAARYDKAAVPILSHATRHYARAYLELDERATKADELLESTGFVYHCEDCLHREAERSLIAHPPESCANCDSTRILEAGPIWLGPVSEPAFAEAVRDEVTEDFGTAKRARKLLDTLAVELDAPTHFDQHRLCKLWGRSASKMETFLETLRDAGYDATPAHYHGTAFKTDATVAEIREATAALDPEA